MNKNPKQQGFSPVIIILSLLAVGIIGFVAWRVYDATKQADNNLKNAADVSTVPPLKDKGDEKEIKNKKIVVPDIDFEIGVDNSLNDLVFEKSIFESQTRVHMSTKTLVSLDSGCKPSEFNSPLGVLIKTPGQYSDLSEEDIPGVLVKQFRDYSISYRSAQAACSDSVQTQKVQTELLKSINIALGINTN